MATFVHMVGYVDWVTFKGNEAKWKMKQPSDLPTLRFELRWLWSNALPTRGNGDNKAGNACMVTWFKKIIRLISG